MKIKFFNEICLSIQLLSNSTYASMHTFSSLQIFLPINYTFDALGEKYH